MTCSRSCKRGTGRGAACLRFPVTMARTSRLYLQTLPGALENPCGLFVKQHKINGFERAPIAQMFRRLAQHDFRAFLQRESRDTGAYGRKCNCLQAALCGKTQRMRRGPLQRFRCGVAAQTYARGVNRVLGFYLAAAGNRRETNGDAADGIALALDRVPAL